MTSFTPQDLALMGITPSNILFVYSWGLGAVLSVWALGFVVGSFKNVIFKA